MSELIAKRRRGSGTLEHVVLTTRAEGGAVQLSVHVGAEMHPDSVLVFDVDGADDLAAALIRTATAAEHSTKGGS